MPSEVMLQVRFVAVSAKTEDDLTNTWHFRLTADPPDATNMALIRDNLGSFYNTLAPNFVNDWSQTLIMKFYNMADPKPRAPVTSYSYVMTNALATTGKNMPRQNTPVISFQAPALSGTTQKRRRGRIYLPCYSYQSMGTDGRLANSTADAGATTANAFLTQSTAAPGYDWVVYSHVAGTSAIVSQVWMDNKVDTQRRRGQDSTYRKVLP
jgi:hypothetical protein